MKTIASWNADDITERKRTETALLESEEKRHTLASQRLMTEERERRLIAIELHDNLGQKLAVIKMWLDELQRTKEVEPGCCDLAPMRDMLEQAIDYTRTLTFQLSPPILHDLGLVPALEWLTEDFRRIYGLNIIFSGKRPAIELGDEARTILFRACRELLMNVVKHAKAQYVMLSVDEKDDRIILAVEDDGVGFKLQLSTAEEKKWNFGLFSIMESMKYLGGDMTVESACDPMKKTRIILAAPLDVLRGEKATGRYDRD